MVALSGVVVAPSGIVDVHQHLWPPALIEALRGFRGFPRLDGWTLHLAGEPPYEVNPQHHDLDLRVAQEANTATALVSLSSPLGIEGMASEIAHPLLAAWHDGAASCQTRFAPGQRCTPSIRTSTDLETRLAAGFVGLQIPATSMATPSAVDLIAPVLRVCEAAGKPVLVHPGPVAVGTDPTQFPTWWPAVVDYTAQMTAAWWSWSVAGRTLLPDLRICFAAGAGLAPVHHERFTVRGGGNPPPIDRLSFVETSSYGPRGLDALIRVLGIDVIVNGTDKPYASTSELRLGDAADRAVRVVNPRRLLGESERR